MIGRRVVHDPEPGPRHDHSRQPSHSPATHARAAKGRHDQRGRSARWPDASVLTAGTPTHRTHQAIDSEPTPYRTRCPASRPGLSLTPARRCNPIPLIARPTRWTGCGGTTTACARVTAVAPKATQTSIVCAGAQSAPAARTTLEHGWGVHGCDGCGPPFRCHSIWVPLNNP